MVKEYLYGAGGQTLTVVDGSQNLLAGETYFGGRYLGTQTPSGFVWAHADALGTVRARSDSAGTLVESYSSGAWGESLSQIGAVSGLHFTGQHRDGETGLDAFPARHYAGNLGRFMSPDPAGLAAVDPNNPQTWNQYAYVINNPASYTDPTGMDSQYYESSQSKVNCTLDGIQTDCGNINFEDADECVNCGPNGEPAPVYRWIPPLMASSMNCEGGDGGLTCGQPSPLQEVRPGFVQVDLDYVEKGCGIDLFCQAFEGFSDAFINGRPSGVVRLAAAEVAPEAAAVAGIAATVFGPPAASALAGYAFTAASAVGNVSVHAGTLASFAAQSVYTNPALTNSLGEFADGFNPLGRVPTTELGWIGLGLGTAYTIYDLWGH
ncbi:MAG: RHS repeat-associated core domain-containing protein [Terriglobales bacterium]